MNNDYISSHVNPDEQSSYKPAHDKKPNLQILKDFSSSPESIRSPEPPHKMVRNVARPPSRPGLSASFISFGLSARQFERTHKSAQTDTANLKILTDVSSPFRIYALHHSGSMCSIE